MKLRKLAGAAMMLCFLSIGILSHSDTAYAKGLTSTKQAEQLALAKVKNATVTDVDVDHEDGKLVYEVELFRGTKEFKLTYRASDAKLVAYEWEEHAVDRYSGTKQIGESKCRELAGKKVKDATITSLVQKYDDGIAIYKVKMKKSNKKFELKYHAGTGQLIEYEWKLTAASSTDAGGYIGLEKAKSIALKEVPGATVLKAKLDTDDGVKVYEVELYKNGLEYEFTIDAKTGKILEMDIDD